MSTTENGNTIRINADQNPLSEMTVVTGFGEISVQGRRREMEDAHVIFPRFRGIESEFFAGVYDGHGGSMTADFLAANLHQNLEQSLKTLDPQEAIREAFLQSDRQVKDIRIWDGATVVVAYINNGTLYVGNVGDARAVLGRGGEGLRLSHDHKADDPDEIKRVEELGGYVTSASETGVARVNGRLAIARAIGDHSPGLEGFVSAEPFITETTLEKGDGPLILACDGIWDVISDYDAIHLTRGLDPKAAAEKLKDEALNRRSRDNISVVLLDLKVS